MAALLAEQKRITEVLDEYSQRTLGIVQRTANRIGDLADVPDSDGCGPVVDRALNILRSEGDVDP